MIIPANRISIKPATKYRNLSFPLVRTQADSPGRIGNLFFKLIKKDAGRAGMTTTGETLFNSRINDQIFSRDSRGGFTLLELMVSFALLGIIVVVIAGAMRLGLRSIESGEKKIGTLERLRASVAIINSQIQSHNPLTSDIDGEKKYYFDGNRESLQFSSNYSIWGGQMGYVVVKYEVGREDDGKMKLNASETFIGTEESRETMLFKSMDDLYFEYFYKDPTAEEGSWTDSWTDETNVPQKIKLHMTYRGKDYSMIIPMRVAGSLGQPAGGVQSLFPPRESDE